MTDSVAANKQIEQRLATGVIGWLVLWAVVFYAPLSVAVSVWSVNDTFNHCFLVLPGALYLLWQQRGLILAQPPAISWLGLLAVLGCLLVYALGLVAYIDLFQHLAVFALIPATALFLFGWKVCLKVWLPLLFILFSVPVGEELVPLFQEITADMAVAMLRFIEVPVYRNALYITVPNGDFVVAEACSGIRFFIACVVIGAAYAYLNFVSVWRALLFFAISIVFPLVANGIRAFGIVYIGHITNMEHAVGADHLIYGWFFFAVVIVLLLAIGYFMSDGARQWNNQIQQVDAAWHRALSRRGAVVAVLPLIIAVVVSVALGGKGQPYQMQLQGYTEMSEEQALALPWAPHFTDADHYWVKAAGAVRLPGITHYIALYPHNEPGKELVSSAHRLFDLDRWTLVSRHGLNVGGEPMAVLNLTTVTDQKRLLAYWYVLPNKLTSQNGVAKVYQAINKILRVPDGGALFAVSLPYRGDVDAALAELQQQLQTKQITPELWITGSE